MLVHVAADAVGVNSLSARFRCCTSSSGTASSGTALLASAERFHFDVPTVLTVVMS